MDKKIDILIERERKRYIDTDRQTDRQTDTHTHTHTHTHSFTRVCACVLHTYACMCVFRACDLRGSEEAGRASIAMPTEKYPARVHGNVVRQGLGLAGCE